MAGKDKSYKWTEDRLILKDVCFECGATSENTLIHYHHIVPFILGGTKAIPLCIKCHGKVHQKDFVEFHRLRKQGLERYVTNGGKLGRKDGSVETIEQWTNKPNVKYTIELLKNPKNTMRTIAQLAKVSTTSVQKVKRYMVKNGIVEVDKKTGKVLPTKTNQFF